MFGEKFCLKKSAGCAVKSKGHCISNIGQLCHNSVHRKSQGCKNNVCMMPSSLMPLRTCILLAGASM